MPFSIPEYLTRINYQGPLACSEEVLKALHRQHVFTIPFENLDVHLNNPIALDEDSLAKKIIRAGRGGYCYEMNGLFALALRKLGFNVSYLTARVRYNIPPDVTLPRMHMLLKVESMGHGYAWLCDVGFGGNGLLEPLPIRPGEYLQEMDSISSGAFQLRVTGVQYTVATRIKGQWQDLYEFTLEEYLPEDFIPFNYYQSNSPDAPFTKRIFCTIPTKTGRIILDGLNLKIRESDATTEHKLATGAEYQKALHEHFKIEIPNVSSLRIKANNAPLFL